MARNPASRPLYRVHSGVYMLIKWERELKEKTGRSLEEWCRLLDLCRSCGDDAGISPCETIIPAYRKHVFAQVSVRTAGWCPCRSP